MEIKTKQVRGRRNVRYASYEDFIADAERLASGEVRALGNWSFGQILKHVAQSFDSSIDGVGFSLPAPARWLMTLFLKKRYLYQAIPPGFKSSEQFIPGETSDEQGLAALREAIDRQSREDRRAPHPGFGKISRDEWTAFNLRHAEMHMSFVEIAP